MLQLKHSDFKKEVLDSEIPVLVDFWASWCLPCKMMEPILEELSTELQGKVKILKVNVDQNPKMRDEYNIMGVPNIILFNSGKEIKRVVGAQSKEQLKRFIEGGGYE